MAASVLYWDLISQEMRLVEYGVVILGGAVSTTINVYLIPMSK